eukprot:9488044-Pyramimonas_sp.AAC.1
MVTRPTVKSTLQLLGRSHRLGETFNLTQASRMDKPVVDARRALHSHSRSRLKHRGRIHILILSRYCIEITRTTAEERLGEDHVMRLRKITHQRAR